MNNEDATADNDKHAISLNPTVDNKKKRKKFNGNHTISTPVQCTSWPHTCSHPSHLAAA